MDANLDVARALANASGGGDIRDPAVLDRIWTTWVDEWSSTPDAERDDPNPYINAVGLAIGQILVDRLGLRWTIATDADGTEMAVHGQPGDVLVYPANLVAKRFDTRETGFLEPVLAGIEERVRSLKSG